ncbi:efflux RND transporter permease subunit [Nitrosomonas communis]|uniref:Cu(I)/Ag(I) efflux system membrane protein CusA/SilA n=1 Tax=Nitrosomonas communis TaxID=44574 RepID=A0A1H2YB00_9PROT|nr:CusA/CzcA family heavy metal efflux RND transporter [Nitrosomonas communis]SDX02412.1 Cu(I)/Ag(I) efflux system membrane protein CusA/SilA [Nitrosomonas communis]
MVEKIIEWSVRHVFLVLLATFALIAWGVYAVWKTPIDAIPDLSDVQVIIYTEYPGQAPQVVEDQVTYPLTTAMLSVPKSKVVRGLSAFGVSFIYIIFEDGTDIYWARSRVLEYLNFAANKLPESVRPALGPDATGVGWVYQYAVTAKDRTLDELRSIQDWFLRYQLVATEGVSEIASVGGFEKTYQITVDPQHLQAYGIPLKTVIDVVAQSNRDVGGRVIELTETEYMVRGRGYLRNISDIENLVVKAHEGMPVLLRDIARVELAPNERRGITELNGEGEAVSGIAIARYGENALDVIHDIEQKINEIKSGLPEGVEIQSVYNRSELIQRAIDTLNEVLVEQVIIVALVCAIFLMHVRSALIAMIMLPIGVLIAFIVMFHLGINSNIMSLAGIALAIAEMTDAAIVMVENTHKHLARLDPLAPSSARVEAVVAACKEVGPPLFFSLLIITVSFLPIFTLEAQEGRMFQPLAFTKTFAMAGGAILSITLVPALILLLIRGRIPREQDNPLGRLLIRLYQPVIPWIIKWKKSIVVIALVILGLTIYPAVRLGTEFMPTLNEGTLLYMPVTLPGISITAAAEIMQTQNKIIKSFPEVASVFGKAGRANTATDPAPLEMTETIINLKPESEWRPGMNIDQLIAELDQALQMPGVATAWTMPIKNRIDMLATGIRTPVGIKVFGNDLSEIEKLGTQIEMAVKTVPGTTSAFAERTTGGYYLDIEPDRIALARYGLAVGDLLDVIKTALGAETITTTVEGRERYGVTVRYPRELRSDPQAIATQVLVPTLGAMIPLGQLAQIKLVKGPPSIRTENALLSAYIFVDIRDRDIGSYIADAQQVVREQIKFPPGYYATWSGQFEYMQRATEKLKMVVPFTLLLVFVLIYLNFGRLSETLIVMLSVPFSLVGGIWLMYWFGYNMSIAVAVGFIGLAGIAAETGMVMLEFLDQALNAIKAKRQAAGEKITIEDLYTAVKEGAGMRIRPVMMTIAGSVFGLLPVMLSSGTGSELTKRIAAPMVGGMISATVLTLIVLPAVYVLVKKVQIQRSFKTEKI